MIHYEYKVIPAPAKGLKARGLKTTQARFAHALETLMNELGAEGWQYQRADTLPVLERSGLTGKSTTYQNMLVFRRPVNETNAHEGIQSTRKEPVLTAPVPHSDRNEDIHQSDASQPNLFKEEVGVDEQRETAEAPSSGDTSKVEKASH